MCGFLEKFLAHMGILWMGCKALRWVVVPVLHLLLFVVGKGNDIIPSF